MERTRKRSNQIDKENLPVLNDSFDDEMHIVTSPKRFKANSFSSSPKPSPRKRSPKIIVDSNLFVTETLSEGTSKKEDNDDLDDSFGDDPVFNDKFSTCETTSEGNVEVSGDSFCDTVTIHKQRSEKIEAIYSGVEGFPSVQDSLLLKVLRVEIAEDGTLDLECREEDNGNTCIVYLQDQWTDCEIKEGMNIRLFGAEKWNDEAWLVTDGKGLVVVDPDTLVPCTSVSASLWCTRKVILNERFKCGSNANKAMLIGCIMHDLFEVAVQCKNPMELSGDWLISRWRNTIQREVVDQLVALKFTPKAFETELMPYAEVIVQWIREHLNSRNRQGNLPTGTHVEKVLPTGTHVENVHDIEDNIWEPHLGLKGKVDATLKVSVPATGDTRLEPLELKTGKSGTSAEHGAQVLLYNLMISRRSKQAIGSGSLLYLKDGVSRAVTSKATELKGVVGQRNRVASHLGRRKFNVLPDLKTDPHYCGKCEQALACCLYKASGLEESQEIKGEKWSELIKEQTSHLTKEDMEYMKRWVRWLHMEWAADDRSRRSRPADLWNMKPIDREARGTCMSDMRLTSKNVEDTVTFWTFQRDKKILDSFTPGGMCTVSDQEHYGIVLAQISGIAETSVTLRTDGTSLMRLLVPGKSTERHESIYEICRFISSLLQGFRHTKIQRQYTSSFNKGKITSRKVETEYFQHLHFLKRYYLDLYESMSTYASTLGNVLTVMAADETCERLRNLLIALDEPIFYTNPLPTAVRSFLSSSNLNIGQRKVIEKAMNAQHYALIEGLPGSGKTSTIAALIRSLVLSGKSVLLVSYTNSAVDNVVGKLIKEMSKSEILRLGRVSSMKSEILSVTLANRLEKLREVKGQDDVTDEYQMTRKILTSTPVVACTCHHTAREVLLSWRKFDFCIVDEASMVLEPIALSSLGAASTFVLVGDRKQLAPLVIDRIARDEGMGVSLFDRLMLAHPKTVVSLTEQFRMNRVLSRVASDLFYEGRLMCANEQVAEAVLNLLPHYRPSTADPSRLTTVLSGKLEDSCVFFDTKSSENVECRMVSHKGGKQYNEGEAKLTSEIVKNLIKAGLSPSDVGVMCVYRGQVAVIRDQLQLPNIEINTVDQYQGRDKEVIIWSLVWTADSKKKSELLMDARRICVALTRARRKLIVIGCGESMGSLDLMRRAIKHMTNVVNYH